MKVSQAVLLFCLCVSFSCTFRGSDEDLREPGNLAGSYMAYGEDYEIETFLAEMEKDVFKVSQGEGIAGMGLKEGELLFLAVRGDSSFAAGIYLIGRKSVDGIWTSGNSIIYSERLSKSGFPDEDQKYFESDNEIESAVYKLTIPSNEDSVETLMLIEPTGKNTFDVLLESENSVVTGVGISAEKYLCICYFDSILDTWGIVFFEITTGDTMRGKISLYGEWKPSSVYGEKLTVE
ncbi:hypothetical protein JXL83_02660 [candidate division WOR-3 bacterium]|nr:hypothetical protein [candidate division WOR-3 bacterium]